MKHIVYLTINLINKKTYIGVHSTPDPDKWDYYLGNGCFANKPSSYNSCKTPFAAAIHKYGPDNFKRITIKVFNSKEEALALERYLVDEEFIKSGNTYNVTFGGENPPILSKIIYQYSLDGVFIKKWDSLKEAADFYGVTHTDEFRAAVNKKRSYKNSFWSNEAYNNLDITEYTVTSYKTGISVYNSDKEFINSFDSIMEAAKAYDLNPSTISNALIECHKVHGLIFIKSDSNIEDFFDKRGSFKKVKNIPIYKYSSETGDFIDSYPSITECIKDMGVGRRRIINSIKNNVIVNGYYLSYFKMDNISNTFPSDVKKPIKINQIDLTSNTIVKVWDIKECRKLYPTSIKVCRGARNKAYGFKWQYVYS